MDMVELLMYIGLMDPIVTITRTHELWEKNYQDTCLCSR